MNRNQYIIDLITTLDDYDLLILSIEYAFKYITATNLEGDKIYRLKFDVIEDREKLKQRLEKDLQT